MILVGGGKGADLFINSYYNSDELYNKNYNIFGILDDKETKSRIYDIPIIGKSKDIINFDPKDVYLFITVSTYMKFRREFYNEYKTIYRFVNFNRSLINRLDKIGEGNFIFPDCSFDYFSEVGNNNVISAGCIIAHHNIIGDNNLFGPGCMFSGTVKIGNNCNFGSGIIIQPRVIIGDNVSVPSGTVITGNISSNSRILSILDSNNIQVYQGNRSIKNDKM